ncbi:MAG: ATP-grasp domain-containing protein [Methanobacteriaceae archaeon]|nr:ATP-grasp domain-containing protein [Methanobacteriaceae archaeon]
MKILIIGSRLLDDIAWYTKENNVTTILSESNIKAENIELADKHYIVERGMEQPKNIAIKEDVDAVIPLIGIDPPLPSIGQLKDELEEDYNIPVIASGYETALLAANKYNTKKFLEENGFNTPHYEKLQKPYNIENILTELPVVLKSPEGQAGRGVKIALSKEDVKEFLDEKNEDLFLENFVDGFELSIEVLRWNNQTIALAPIYKGNTTLEGTHPLQKIKQAPFDMGKNKEYYRKLATKIADIVNSEGTMDIDILYDKHSDKEYLIELNTRPSGTRYMTAATTGINPLTELVNMAIGTFNTKSLEKNMKEYFAAEIPIGDFSKEKYNPGIKYYLNPDSYIIHGPEHYNRITITAKTKQSLNKIVSETIPEYIKEHNITTL